MTTLINFNSSKKLNQTKIASKEGDRRSETNNLYSNYTIFIYKFKLIYLLIIMKLYKATKQKKKKILFTLFERIVR